MWAIQTVQGSSGVRTTKGGTGVDRGPWRRECGGSRAHTMEETGRGCNGIQPAASPWVGCDTQTRLSIHRTTQEEGANR
jgi:hypothetical protein